MALLKPLLVFFLAGLCEIGGGHGWQWLVAGRPTCTGAAGAVLLMRYGWIVTW